MISSFAIMAMHRFGTGFDPESVRNLSNANGDQAKQWLRNQLVAYALDTSDWSSANAIESIVELRGLQQRAKMQSNQAQQQQDSLNQKRADIRLHARSLAESIVKNAISTRQPLQARLLDFFSNHFSVSRSNPLMVGLAPTLDSEAIAPNLHRTFAEMLLNVIQHPAMLIYLNNERSVGPNSRFAKSQQAKKRRITGLNENLAREILELHTLGVDAGYSQTDVTELARALTGWSVGNPARGESAGFIYRHLTHEPGARRLLNKTYDESKESTSQQATAMLSDLAMHPSTAQHLCTKLARHFISDSPSIALINSMRSVWLSSKSNIPKVIEAMLSHQDAWKFDSEKLKTPREFVISTCRSCQIDLQRPSYFESLEMLGQGVNNAGSPAGYPDTAQQWAGPSAMMARIEWASHISRQFHNQLQMSPLQMANAYFANALSTTTLNHLKRAESVKQAMTLWLMSPEFQRR